MRFLIAALLVFIAVPGFAQERVPSWQDSQLVPDPIPADICVEVHWTDKSRSQKEGWLMHIQHPPLSLKTIAALNQVRNEGKAVLVRCSATDT